MNERRRSIRLHVGRVTEIRHGNAAHTVYYVEISWGIELAGYFLGWRHEQRFDERFFSS